MGSWVANTCGSFVLLSCSEREKTLLARVCWFVAWMVMGMGVMLLLLTLVPFVVALLASR